MKPVVVFEDLQVREYNPFGQHTHFSRWAVVAICLKTDTTAEWTLNTKRDVTVLNIWLGSTTDEPSHTIVLRGHTAECKTMSSAASWSAASATLSLKSDVVDILLQQIPR